MSGCARGDDSNEGSVSVSGRAARNVTARTECSGQAGGADSVPLI